MAEIRTPAVLLWIFFALGFGWLLHCYWHGYYRDNPHVTFHDIDRAEGEFKLWFAMLVPYGICTLYFGGSAIYLTLMLFGVVSSDGWVN